ncbi:MAG: phage portal protein [Lachnospiraceae bacterium]|nr:phage portal protein [Lachnospiraceae bacterium]
MKTYQDLMNAGGADNDRAKFCIDAVQEFRGDPLFRTARDADAYYRHLNPTIMRAQKMVYNLLGQATPDIYRPNHKIPCRFFFYFVTQEIMFLLGNGVIFSGMKDKDKRLGRDFDSAVQRAGRYALCGGMSFGFWNHDHLEVFPLFSADEPSFCPLWDEETGMLRAGIRWWQLAPDKPMRMTLYESDGITEYVAEAASAGQIGEAKVLKAKSQYKTKVVRSEATGEMVYGAGNYSTLPIIPLYNVNRQSELIGGRETLDAYDLMVSGLVNNTDEGNLIYWVLKNANAMDEEDDARFIEQLRRTHVAHADGDDGVGIESHTLEVPVDASEAAIDRLRRQLFDDFMALDVKEISGGATTATQIRAAYEPLNQKTSMFEYCVTDFLRQILALVGITEEPTYRRDTIVNATEELQNILSAASYLDLDTMTRQICGVLGLIDDADEIIKKRKEEELDRFSGEDEEEEPEEEEETEAEE